MPARIGARRMEAAHTRLKGGGGRPPYPAPTGFRWVPAVWDAQPALLKGQTGFILMPAT